MVPKASQRANGQQLAIHLLNAHDNERVEVVHIRGAIARDLPGALEEWHAVSKVTRCKKFLYSLSINPDPRQGPLTRSQYKDYIARVEKKLGLGSQPRAIVFHSKEGREHCHVVWSRIIADQLKAVQISHDRKSLQTITRKFAKDHGLTLPANMRESSAVKDPTKSVTLYEKHQQERTGVSKEERVRVITQIWQDNGTGQSFIAALQQAGYHLAKGDTVPYAVVDRFGEIHSLPRQIQGARTADIRERLAEYPPESLVAATALQQQIRRQIPADITHQFNESAKELRARLKTSQESRRSVFHGKLAAMKDRHRAQRAGLVRSQKSALQQLREERLRASAKGFMAILCAIPFIRSVIARWHRKHDLASLQQCRAQRQALTARQRAEFEDLKRQARAIVRVEKRERRSLKTKLHRDFLQARIPANLPLPSPTDTAAPLPPHSEKIEAFVDNAHDMTSSARTRRTQTTPPRQRKPPPENSLSAAFTPPPPALRAAFTKAARSTPRKPAAPRTQRLEFDG